MVMLILFFFMTMDELGSGTDSLEGMGIAVAILEELKKIGEAGESCAFYIARRLGMPMNMLQKAADEAYGKGHDISELSGLAEDDFRKKHTRHVIRKKEHKQGKQIEFHRGDSVMVYPDKKIGIVCREANDKGVLQVQLKGKKICERAGN